MSEHKVKANGDSASVRHAATLQQTGGIRHAAILQQAGGVRTRIQSLYHLEEDSLRVSLFLLTNGYLLKS